MSVLAPPTCPPTRLPARPAGWQLLTRPHRATSLARSQGFGALRTLFDEAWYLDTPPEESHRRLSARHQSAWGISEAEAERRIAVNDGINSVLVQRSSVLADALVL